MAAPDNIIIELTEPERHVFYISHPPPTTTRQNKHTQLWSAETLMITAATALLKIVINQIDDCDQIITYGHSVAGRGGRTFMYAAVTLVSHSRVGT